ncbi:UNVERIFIED_CONTAM: hypothetical protein RMT77_017843 [Armadillidium vulgare]
MSGEKIIRSPALPVAVPDGNFVNTVFRDAEKWMMKDAIECSESGVTYTYSELLDQIKKWSGFFKSLELDLHDSVTIVSSNCLQYVPIFFGTISSGTIVILLNPHLSPNEMRRLILNIESKFIVFSKEFEDSILLALKEDISKYELFCIGNPLKLKARNVDDILYGKEFMKFPLPAQVSWLIAIPTLLNLLINSPRCTEETLRSLNTLICGADPVPRSSIEAFRKKFNLNIDILEAYGTTETLIAIAMPRNCKDFEGCGRLLSNVQGKIICIETGETLGPNQTGEICIKSLSVMKRYFNNQKETDNALKNGWFHSGDIGYYDEDEFFYVTDRLKNMIKVDDCQVYPSEIENELQKHPLVEECCVIGKPDLEHGEVPLAFVVTKEEVSEEELQNYMKDKLSEFKQLKGGIKFVECLPKSDNGKILKSELKLKI